MTTKTNEMREFTFAQAEEYIYVMPDETKGWNQPFSGLKNKMAVDYLPPYWRERVVSVNQFLKI